MSFDLEKLYALLPSFYRVRDVAAAEQLAQLLAESHAGGEWVGLLTAGEEAERQQRIAARQSLFAAGEPFPSADAERLQELEDKRTRGPLKALFAILAEQVAVLEEDLAQLYDDQFIETCAEWVVPYIGDLVGTRGLFYYPNAKKLSRRAQVANTLAYRRRKGTASVLEQLARDVTEWDASVVEYFQLLATTQYMNHLRPENLSFTSVRGRHFAGLGGQATKEGPAEASERQWLALEYANSPTDNEPCAPGYAGPCWRTQSPFDRLTRTADVRNVESRRGRYNIPNVGIFLWRIGSYSVTDAPAYRVADVGDPTTDGRRFLFNAAGRGTQLYNRPVTEDEITHLSEPLNVPAPLGRRVLDRFLEIYYGDDDGSRDTGNSLLVGLNGGSVVGGEPPPRSLRDLVKVCDLSDKKDAGGNVVGWHHHPANKIAIDPVLGRLAFPKTRSAPRAVRVTYHYGFGAEMGGGEYGRAETFTKLETVVRVVHRTPRDTIKEGFDALNALLAADPRLPGGVVEIADNDYYAALRAHVPARRQVELRAADERRPCIVLNSGAVVTGGQDGEAVLNGLLIAAGVLRVALLSGNRLGKLVLRHCTIAPGPSPAFPRFNVPAHPTPVPNLVVEIPDVEVEIDSCILGGLRVHEGSRVRVRNSIIDAGAETAVAYEGLNGPGGPLDIENSTVVGRVHTERVEASNTIFLAGFKPGDAWPGPASPMRAPVLAQRVQEGCVRFSYVPPGSHVPRPFHCQPAKGTDDARVRPSFNSLRYGDAAYGQLSRHCAAEIREGADDGAEMGAFHDLYQPQRVANLRARLDEYLRFGLEAGIFFAT